MSLKGYKLAYLAGIVDGEGSIMIKKEKKKYYSLHIQVNNTNYGLIEWLYTNFGGYMNRCSIEPRKEGHKLVYGWYVSRRKAGAILEKIYPYLVCKREQAHLGMEFDRIKTIESSKNRKKFLGRENAKRKWPKEYFSMLEEMQLRMKELNKRGTEIPVQANTSDSGKPEKIESELTGNSKSEIREDSSCTVH